MSIFTPASKVLLRHSADFKKSRILFAGDIQDDLPARFICTESRVHTQFYHYWQVLNRQMGEHVQFSLVADKDDIADCDTLVYYWPKNKLEAQFQLTNLLSLRPAGCNIFVVGENHSGVRSVEKMFEAWAPLKKIDNARRCSLYRGRLETQITFIAETFWGEYQFNGLTIKTLPGIFSHKGVDVGSRLLISTLTQHTTKKGAVLDVGCGAGVLSAVLASQSPKMQLTLCDVSASAIEASRATLAANRLKGVVFASNVFSDITGRYDLIISNPPFHYSTKTNLEVAQKLIRGAMNHLNIGGELRIVANVFLPYPRLLDDTFGFHEVIAQTGCFKVYRTLMMHQI